MMILQAPEQPEPAGDREARALARRNSRAEAIASKAEKLFVNRGFDAVSMDMIADSAGMSKVTVYKYFQSKDELLTSIVRQWVARINERIWRLDEHAQDLRSVLQRIAENFYEVYLTDEALSFRRMLFGVLPRFPELGRMIYETGPAALMAKIADVLRAATDRGDAAVDDPEFAAIQFFSLLQSDLEVRGILLSQMPSKADLARRVEHGVDLFVRYYTPRN